MPKTLFDKVWDRHIVIPETEQHPATLYIGLHLIHEVTSPQAFTVLKERGLSVRRPDRTLATIDHSTPTLINACLLYTSPSPRDGLLSRMPSSA